MRRATWWIAGTLIAGAACPAWCQAEKPSASAPGAAAQEAANLAEQIAVLKAINPLRLTDEQLQAILDVLKPAMEKLAQQDQANAKQMAAVVPQLRQAAAQVSATPNQTTPPELEYHRLQWMSQQGRARLRDQVRKELRALFEKSLSPEQRRAVIAAGRSFDLQQRLQEWQSGARGPIDAIARSLDQLRQTDPRTYADARQRFALQQADVPQWWRYAPGLGGGRRGQNRQQQPPQNQDALNDPAIQARLRSYLAMAEQVRRMPAAAYQQQRPRLAVQVWQDQENRRVQTRPEEAIDTFLNRVLLSQAAVEALEARLKRAG